MKRIVALAMGLVMLAGCGAAGAEEPATTEYHTTQPEYTTIPSAPAKNPDARYLPCVASLPEDNIYI